VLQQGSFSSEKDVISRKNRKEGHSSDGSYISLRGKVYAEVKTASYRRSA